jgi:hypothetical protein
MVHSQKELVQIRNNFLKLKGSKDVSLANAYFDTYLLNMGDISSWITDDLVVAVRGLEDMWSHYEKHVRIQPSRRKRQVTTR